MADTPPPFHPETGPTVRHLAAVLEELQSQASNYGFATDVGRICVRAYDCLDWLARDYLTPEHLRDG